MNFSKWINKDLHRLRITNIILGTIIGIIILVIVIAVFGFIQGFKIEKYCEKQAKAIVGDQWDKLYPAVGYEKDYASEITWGFREQLKCEKKTSIFKVL